MAVALSGGRKALLFQAAFQADPAVRSLPAEQPPLLDVHGVTVVT